MISYKKFISFLIPWLSLALIMNLTRFALTDIHSYVYMNWNLFLAFLVIVFLFLFEKSHVVYGRVFFFILWLFFFPNAIYMLTDFIHLRNVGPDWLLWYDAMMIFAYAVIGVFISAYSLLKIRKQLFTLNNKAYIFSFLIALVSSFGVYLGRYLRLNSWDFIFNPIYLIQNVVSVFSTQSTHPVFITTIIFFTFFILLSTESLQKVFEHK